MKKVSLVILFLGIILITIGIIKERENKVDDAMKNPKEPPLEESVGNEESVDRIESEFSIKVKDQFIALREYRNDLGHILGDPMMEEVEVLGREADTFSGSHIKTLTYDGLIIEEMSPKETGNDRFWILSMTIKNEKYSTGKGLTIGDGLEKMEEFYAQVEVFKDGRTDLNNCAYIFKSGEQPNYIIFEVKDGIIDEIKIYYELQ